MDRRSFLRLAAGTAALGALSATGARAATSPGVKTFVLVHGAWTGGWIWQAVAATLRQQGHRVYTPTCSGVGERAHMVQVGIGLDTWIDDVVAVLEWEDLQDVILVGSGFAGVVISGVADRAAARLQRLVYFDALVIPAGVSAFDQFPAALQVRRRQEIAASGRPDVLPAPTAASFGLKEPAALARVEARLRPQPLKTYTDPLRLHGPLGAGLPKVYVDCTEPPFPPLKDVKVRLKSQGGWQWRELAASHDAMVSHPEQVAALFAAL